MTCQFKSWLWLTVYSLKCGHQIWSSAKSWWSGKTCQFKRQCLTFSVNLVPYYIVLTKLNQQQWHFSPQTHSTFLCQLDITCFWQLLTFHGYLQSPRAAATTLWFIMWYFPIIADPSSSCTTNFTLSSNNELSEVIGSNAAVFPLHVLTPQILTIINTNIRTRFCNKQV